MGQCLLLAEWPVSWQAPQVINFCFASFPNADSVFLFSKELFTIIEGLPVLFSAIGKLYGADANAKSFWLSSRIFISTNNNVY